MSHGPVVVGHLCQRCASIDDGVSPFAVVMEAEKVEPAKISDKTFKQNKSLAVKSEDDL